MFQTGTDSTKDNNLADQPQVNYTPHLGTLGAADHIGFNACLGVTSGGMRNPAELPLTPPHKYCQIEQQS